MDLDPRELCTWIPADAEFIHIDADRCAGCGSCVQVCVAGIWSLDPGSGLATLALDYPGRCFECGACDQVCPEHAIQFRYPPGGTGVVFEQG